MSRSCSKAGIHLHNAICMYMCVCVYTVCRHKYIHTCTHINIYIQTYRINVLFIYTFTLLKIQPIEQVINCWVIFTTGWEHEATTFRRTRPPGFQKIKPVCWSEGSVATFQSWNICKYQQHHGLLLHVLTSHIQGIRKGLFCSFS